MTTQAQAFKNKRRGQTLFSFTSKSGNRTRVKYNGSKAASSKTITTRYKTRRGAARTMITTVTTRVVKGGMDRLGKGHRSRSSRGIAKRYPNSKRARRGRGSRY